MESIVDDPEARTSLCARIAARLQYLDDDPLDFWDYGMLCAFEIVEVRIRELIKGGRERIKLSDLLKIVAAEQQIVQSEGLHSFYQVLEPTWNRTDRVVRRPKTAEVRVVRDKPF